MGHKASVRDIEVERRRVFCRVDFNVPLSDGRVADDTRIVAALPTLRHLAERGAGTVLASHLGRPNGKVQPEMSLRPVAERLAELIDRPVAFASDCIGEVAEAAADEVQPGDFLLLENLRFHAEETVNDREFSRALARLADVYVNDAFGTAHRAHASTSGLPALLKPAAAGFLMDGELTHLGRLIESPATPFVAILGGAKVSDKIELIDNLLPRVDRFLVGGAMAYTFLLARGVAVGDSRIEPDKLELAASLLAKAEEAGQPFLLPSDHVIMRGGDEHTPETVARVELAEGEAGCDIGPRTVEAFTAEIGRASTVLWNGPVGRFELDAFAAGSRAVAQALADSGAVRVVGGGDTAAAVRKFGLTDRMTHVSTGGGASLEFLSGRVLPGVAALDDARQA